MLDLTLLQACDVLTNRRMLGFLEQWAEQVDWHPEQVDDWHRLRSSLNFTLRSRFKEMPPASVEKRHFNQVELAFEHLAHAESVFRSSALEHGIPHNEAQSIETTLTDSLFVSCLRHVASAILCDDRGRVALRWESLDVAQRLVRFIESSQLTAMMMAMRRHMPGAPYLSEEQVNTELENWSRDAVLPPVAGPLFAALSRKGLVEVHRHANISLHSILVWSKLMSCDRLPNKLESDVKAWLRAAQIIRAYLSWELGESTPPSRMPPMSPRWLAETLQSAGRRLPIEVPPMTESWCLPKGYFQSSDVPFERQFLYRLFERLLVKPNETLIATVHAYCLLQNLVLTTLVMPVDGNDGLDRFTRRFDNHPMYDIIAIDTQERLVQAYRTGCVHWLEARVAPGDDPRSHITKLANSFAQRLQMRGKRSLWSSSILPVTKLLAEQRPLHEDSLPAVGIIFHFVKRVNSPELDYEDEVLRQSSTIESSCQTQIPLVVPGSRDQQHRYHAWQQTNAIADLIATSPLAARLIVGFDVCGSEAATEMGTYACHLRYLRQLGRQSALWRGLEPSHPEDWYRSKRTFLTCHAGEDFNHLLGGLRHIDEALEFFELREGDRIGHGTALGVSPANWLERVGGRCILRQGEWLDDLVWFHQWLARTGSDGAVRYQVAQKIAELGCAMYDSQIGIDDIWEAWRLRGENPTEPFPTLDDVLNTTPLLLGGRYYAWESLRQRMKEYKGKAKDIFKLWMRYHCDPKVRFRWKQTCEIKLEEHWIKAMESVQTALLSKVIASRVVIEINPSSNLTLGPLSEMIDHPVFRWLDPRTDYNSAHSPLVVVGSDDPCAFATELIHEYAYLARAAEQLGATQRQIEQWLDHLRNAGVDYSFFPRESFEPICSQLSMRERGLKGI